MPLEGISEYMRVNVKFISVFISRIKYTQNNTRMECCIRSYRSSPFLTLATPTSFHPPFLTLPHRTSFTPSPSLHTSLPTPSSLPILPVSFSTYLAIFSHYPPPISNLQYLLTNRPPSRCRMGVSLLRSSLRCVRGRHQCISVLGLYRDKCYIVLL